MHDFVQTAESSLFLASIYALVAAGFVILFRASRLFNFAHGEVMVVAGYLVFTAVSSYHQSFVAAVLIALVMSAVFGALIYLVLMSPLTGAPLFSLVILTLGVQISADALIRIIWGGNVAIFPSPSAYHAVHLPVDTILSRDQLAAIGIAIAVFAALYVFFNFSRIGIHMRAAAENPLLASQSGVNVTLVFAVAWGLAALLGGIAGVVYANSTHIVTADVGALGLRAFPAGVIGGIDSIVGVMPGALVIAFVENFATRYWDPTAKDVVTFGIMLVVLMIRPYGFFGSREIDRV
jgi:branched-chain amino acid transport system permease protein